jgi:hypothetical protein
VEDLESLGEIPVSHPSDGLPDRRLQRTVPGSVVNLLDVPRRQPVQIATSWTLWRAQNSGPGSSVTPPSSRERDQRRGVFLPLVARVSPEWRQR